MALYNRISFVEDNSFDDKRSKMVEMQVKRYHNELFKYIFFYFRQKLPLILTLMMKQVEKNTPKRSMIEKKKKKDFTMHAEVKKFWRSLFFYLYFSYLFMYSFLRVCALSSFYEFTCTVQFR